MPITLVCGIPASLLKAKDFRHPVFLRIWQVILNFVEYSTKVALIGFRDDFGRETASIRNKTKGAL